ncbi:MAG: SPOR domain-containing protein, partial [Muribaculaceae bacterium]|nr:SPOR domain-containing protein [Muribaculaceae bacterium]
MKNFTYRSLDEKENIEEILKRRRRKVNRQQIVSVFILIAILGSLALYIGHHFFYSLLDGYV